MVLGVGSPFHLDPSCTNLFCLVIESLVILPDHSAGTPEYLQAYLTRSPLISDKRSLPSSKMNAPRKYMEEHGFVRFFHTIEHLISVNLY